jgi:25S rRNA (cytosine2278-C5)-methyltransferase
MDDSIYMEGKIILQDKASCIPALVLAPPVSDDAVVIDATSAPGNKTSHLSALMKGKGKASRHERLSSFSSCQSLIISAGRAQLLAFERDRKRYSTLKMMLAKARCTNVEAVNADFLLINPLDPAYGMVTHM